jgi:patatin-like phospholipase/acyl hydrolase
MRTLLTGLRIWLSGSIPKEASAEERDQILTYVREFAREVFNRGGQIIHGSDPSIRDTLISVAEERDGKSGLVLLVSRYFSKNAAANEIDLDRWNRCCAKPVIQTREAVIDGIPTDEEVREQSLVILRRALVEQSNLFVAVGGKWWLTDLPRSGVPKEILLATDDGLPMFLLGGLGGATRGFLESHPEILRRCRNGLDDEANKKLAEIESPRELADKILDQVSLLPIRERDPDNGRAFRILALDGGGIRGAYTAAMLAYWEKAIAPRRIVDHFDLISGTSTGGILAIGMGLGLTAEAMLNFYVGQGPRIFPTENASDRWWHSFRHWFTSKFDQAVLKNALNQAFASTGKTTLDESICRLVIPSYNTAADQINIFRTPHGPFRSTHSGQDAVIAALATAAAPTYFDPVMTRGPVAAIQAVDGGVWANNPVTVALAEAVGGLGIPLNRIEILSLGTTYPTALAGQPLVINGEIIGTVVNLGAGRLWSWLARIIWRDVQVRGKIGWVANIAEFLMKTQGQTADHVAAELLGNRFYRIDEASNIDLDDSQAITRLTGMGQGTAPRHFKRVQVQFLNGVPVDDWK